MADPPELTRICAILLDIEGTTTPVEFVYQTLFPYARRRVKEFITQRQASSEVRAAVAELCKEHAADTGQNLRPPPWREESAEDRVDSAVSYLSWLMDRDRKSTFLKSIQGKIWEVGYRSGELRGEVYPDVLPAFERWQRQKKDIAIFSSGSILAQKLLFRHTTAGDLTPFIRTYFDTASGPKNQAESYHRIAGALRLPPAEVLFLSDVTAELDASRLAGMQTALCVRTGQPPDPAPTHPVIHSLDEIR